MKINFMLLPDRYLAALQQRLSQEPSPTLRPTMMRKCHAGQTTLELARIHAQALATLRLPGTNGFGQAEIFFSETLASILRKHQVGGQSKMDFQRLNQTLNKRTLELAVRNRQLKRKALRCEKMKGALKRTGEHHAKLLKESLRLQTGLKELARQLLVSQEEERKKIALEIESELGQTLLGVNARLLSLKMEAKINTKEFRNEIAGARRLIAKSSRSVQRAARELGSL